MRRPAAPLDLAWALAWALACQDPEPTGPTGPAEACPPVGLEVDLADATSGHRVVDAPSAPAWAEPRTLPLHLWYPTADTAGPPTSYLGIFPDPESLDGASFQDRSPGCQLPLVLYSHGYRGWAGNETDVLRQFVRAGWIAAAPDHVGNTLLEDEDPPMSFDLTRTADLSASLDALASLPADDPLAGRIDTDRVLVLGHSYGGQTAWLMSGPAFDPAAIDARCAESDPPCTSAERAAFDAPVDEPRVVAVAPLDGAAGTDLVAAEGWSTRRTPVLYLSQDDEGAAEQYARAAGDGVTWVRVEGSCHESFTSTELPCDLPKEEGLELVAGWLLAYGATQVRGQEGFQALASGERSLSDRAIVSP